MNIGIAFFGLPRNTDRTFSSIEEHILRPASQFGDIVPCYHFFNQTHVVNPRSLENAVLDFSQYLPFVKFQGVLENPEGIPEKCGLAAIAACGDAWRDDFKSLRNLLLQLHSLHQVTTQLETFLPDIVIYARPDLLYHNSFESDLKAMLTSINKRAVRLPFWQWAGGYNDRFAICGKDAFAVYGKRIEQITAYLNAYSEKPLHAERLLRFALDKESVAVRPLNVQATRIRVGGNELQEDFSRVQTNRLIRWGVRESKKSVLRVLHGASQ
jgi:hypothetical protein